MATLKKTNAEPTQSTPAQPRVQVKGRKPDSDDLPVKGVFNNESLR